MVGRLILWLKLLPLRLLPLLLLLWLLQQCATSLPEIAGRAAMQAAAAASTT
jgi:hypothetical protein